jgi:hypothetical protein
VGVLIAVVVVNCTQRPLRSSQLNFCRPLSRFELRVLESFISLSLCRLACRRERTGLHVLIPKTQIDIDEGAYCFRPLSSRSGSRSSQARPVPTEDDSDINEDPDRSTRTFGNSPLREWHLLYAKQVDMSDMGVWRFQSKRRSRVVLFDWVIK